MSSTGHDSVKGSARQHANFQARTATDDHGELNRRSTLIQGEQPTNSTLYGTEEPEDSQNPYEPATNSSAPQPRLHSFTRRFLKIPISDNDSSKLRGRSTSRRRHDARTVQMNNEAESKRANGDPVAPKAGLGPRPIGGSEKLGMFSGVYVPTCLNVLSILMFLRFGFILGNSS